MQFISYWFISKESMVHLGRRFLCIIFFYVRIFVKMVRLIPMCLNGTYSKFRLCISRAELDGTRAENGFRLSPKQTSAFKSVGASVQLTAGSRGVRISFSNAAYTMLGSGVRVLATHSIRQFSLHFPSRASSCAIRFRKSSTYLSGVFPTQNGLKQGDGLLSWLFNFVLYYDFRTVQVNQQGCKVNWTQHLVVYTNGADLMTGNVI